MNRHQDKTTKRIRSRKADELTRMIAEIRADPEAMRQVKQLVAGCQR
jgi:hypothetical protein